MLSLHGHQTTAINHAIHKFRLRTPQRPYLLICVPAHASYSTSPFHILLLASSYSDPNPTLRPQQLNSI